MEWIFGTTTRFDKWGEWMTAWRVSMVVAILLVLAVAGWWWWGREYTAPVLKKILPGQPGTTIAGSTLIWWERGEKAGEIRAHKVWRSKDGNVAVLEDIKDTKLYYDDEEIIVDAPIARLDQARQIITVSGGVKARMKKGIFETESLRMDRLKNNLVSDGKIIFRYEGATITADLLQGDLNKKTVRLIGNVVVQEGSQILRGEELEYNLEDETYIVLGGTEVEFEL